MSFIFRFLSKILIAYLNAPSSSTKTRTTHSLDELKKALQPGDVLLVEGKQRFSTAIKYLTQSNWSHSALYVGEGKLVEADLKLGVIEIEVETYADYHTRICRPHRVNDADIKKVVNYVKSEIGHSYDLKNIIDLARYLVPTPPIPTRWRRKMLYFGSGDPTKVICSSLVAQAFQKIHYPILPLRKASGRRKRWLARHHTLFTPSDFDRSPYFEIIKPTLNSDFDYKKINWSEGKGTL